MNVLSKLKLKVEIPVAYFEENILKYVCKILFNKKENLIRIFLLGNILQKDI